MSTRKYAVIFGVVFLAVGIIGFIPVLNPQGYLLDIFQIDKIHNLFHVLTGLIAFSVAFSSVASRAFFKIFGLVYLFIALLGILVDGNFIFMKMNLADQLFHLVVAAIAIYLGFGKVKKPAS